MTDKQKSERVEELLKSEDGNPEVLWYLSYATTEKFLGATVMRTKGFFHAVLKAKQLGISPGGSVRGYPLARDTVIDDKWLDRLLTKAGIKRAFAEDEKAMRNL